MSTPSTTQQMRFVVCLMLEGIVLLGVLAVGGELLGAIAVIGGIYLVYVLNQAINEVKQSRASIPKVGQAQRDEALADVFYRVDFSAPTTDETVACGRRSDGSKDVPITASRSKPFSNKARSSQERPKRLAQIEFSYVDGDGLPSHRTVKVTAVNHERFEGYCLHARGTRTFLVERVQGDVIDTETGEVIAPARWAKALKKSTGGGSFEAVPIQKQRYEKPDRKPAIHFTGFRQAEKEALEEQAELAGLYVAGSVVKDLRYLVVGPTQSKKKMADAEAIGAEILNRDEFSMRF